MKYIEIDDGITVKTDAIEGIRRLTATTTEIIVQSHKYLAIYPYETILALLKEEEVIKSNSTLDEKTKNTMEKLDAVLNKATHFAG